MTTTIANTTTETFLGMARDAILERADITPEIAERLRTVKVTYGAGMPGVRGVTYFNAWQSAHASSDTGVTDFVEIGAMCQDTWVQLAGTLLHELAHSAAGLDAGHSVEWKDTAVRMGFTKRPEAAGQRYWLSLFRPELRRALYDIARTLQDGSPLFSRQQNGSAAPKGAVRPCRAGIGTRGGTSRGKGSGSRLRLWECRCERLCQSGACPTGGVHNSGRQSCKPVKVRVASDSFDATCNVCGHAFEQK